MTGGEDLDELREILDVMAYEMLRIVELPEEAAT